MRRVLQFSTGFLFLHIYLFTCMLGIHTANNHPLFCIGSISFLQNALFSPSHRRRSFTYVVHHHTFLTHTCSYFTQVLILFNFDILCTLYSTMTCRVNKVLSGTSMTCIITAEQIVTCIGSWTRLIAVMRSVMLRSWCSKLQTFTLYSILHSSINHQCCNGAAQARRKWVRMSPIRLLLF